MSRNTIPRLFTGSICTSCRTRIRHAQLQPFRSLTTTPKLEANPPRRPGQPSNLSSIFASIGGGGDDATPPPPPASSTGLADAINQMSLGQASGSDRSRTTGYGNMLNGQLPAYAGIPGYGLRGAPAEPHHFHIYTTKHNTHICLTRPNREPILSFSSGNIGFRKAQRGSYDAGFQLTAYVMKMIQDRGLLRSPMREMEDGDGVTSKGKGVESPIGTLEVVIRGFGKGREAVVKALLGNEGRLLRGKVVKISDATRLKFGGTRSPNPRRLG